MNKKTPKDTFEVELDRITTSTGSEFLKSPVTDCAIARAKREGMTQDEVNIIIQRFHKSLMKQIIN